MKTLSQNAVSTVFVDMVPPTASHSGNRAAGATKLHQMRTAPAAAITRSGTVRENQLRRRTQTTWQFPDDQLPDTIGPAAASRSLELSMYFARFARCRSVPVACNESLEIVESAVHVQPAVHDKNDALDALVDLDALSLIHI